MEQGVSDGSPLSAGQHMGVKLHRRHLGVSYSGGSRQGGVRGNNGQEVDGWGGGHDVVCGGGAGA